MPMWMCGCVMCVCVCVCTSINNILYKAGAGGENQPAGYVCVCVCCRKNIPCGRQGRGAGEIDR